MAVYNDYVEANILAEQGNRAPAFAALGSKLISGRVVFDTTAAHDAGSIYRVIKAIPSTAVLKYLDIFTDGVTGMTDVNVGLYEVGAGAPEVGTEVLASTINLSSAVTQTAAANNGMGNIANANKGKMLYELAGETVDNKNSHYDIGLDSVADLSEADTIVVDFAYWAP